MENNKNNDELNKEEMTDEDKFRQVVMMCAHELREKDRMEMDKAAGAMRMMYDSYVKAGFTPKQSMDIIMTLMVTAMKK